MLSLFSAVPTLDRVFDDVMRDTFGAFASATTFAPSVDVRSEENRLVFQLDVPGVKESDLAVEIVGNVLSVRGERKFTGDGEGQALYGRSYGAFERSWKLPEGLDTEKLSASLDSGVLTIEIAKHPKAMPRRVPILTASAAPKQMGEGPSTEAK